MEYFKATKKPANEDPALALARRIVEIARLHDPEVKEFPNDPEEAAKLLYERVLKPTPDFKNGNGLLNGYDDRLDFVAAKRLIECVCNLKFVENPFEELGRYHQVKAFFNFCDGFRKKGWQLRVAVSKHGGDGEVEELVEKRTSPRLRRVEAAFEGASLIMRHTQHAFASPGE